MTTDGTQRPKARPKAKPEPAYEPSPKLTPRQLEILTYLYDRIHDSVKNPTKQMPSVRTVGRYFGIDVCSAFHHIEALRMRGCMTAGSEQFTKVLTVAGERAATAMLESGMTFPHKECEYPPKDSGDSND